MRYLGKGSISSFLGSVLDIVWYLWFVVAGGILMAMLTSGFLMPRLMGKPFRIDAEFLRLTFTQVEFRNQRLIYLGFLGLALISLLIAQAIIYQLRRIFRTLRTGTGNPFTKENASRIRAIGLITIGGTFLRFLAGFILGLLMRVNIMIQGVELSYRSSLHLSSIFMGLVILILAEVFWYGASLQEDQNLTV